MIQCPYCKEWFISIFGFEDHLEEGLKCWRQVEAEKKQQQVKDD